MLLGEDLLLVLLDAEGKTLGRVRAPLAGAVVWDLAKAGVIRLDDKRPVLQAPAQDLDPLLRAALDLLVTARGREASATVRALSDFAGPALRDRLWHRGLIAPPGQAGPPIEGSTYRAAVVAHLQRVIAGQADADTRSAALIALVAMTGGIGRLVRPVNWTRIHAVQESGWVMTATQFVTGKPGSPDWLTFWNN